MTKREVAEIIAEQTGMTMTETETVINGFFEVVAQRLRQGERLEFRGFGSFFAKYRAPKDARNPGTNEIVKVPERYVPVFKPSNILRNRVDKSNKKGKF